MQKSSPKVKQLIVKMEKLSNIGDEPPTKRKRENASISGQYCWKCFRIGASLKCAVPFCGQYFHVACVPRNLALELWKCMDCKAGEMVDTTKLSETQLQTLNAMLQVVEAELRNRHSLIRFDPGDSLIKEKIRNGKYESRREFVVDVKEAIINYFQNKKSGVSNVRARDLAKKLVEACNEKLSNFESRSMNKVSNDQIDEIIQEIDGFAGKIKRLCCDKQRLETDFESLSSERIQLMDQINETKLQKDKIQLDLTNSRSEVDDAKNKLDTFIADRKQLNEANRKLFTENLSLRSSLEFAERTNSELRLKLLGKSHKAIRLEEALECIAQKKLDQQKIYFNDMEKVNKIVMELDSKLTECHEQNNQLKRKLALKTEDFNKVWDERNTSLNENKKFAFRLGQHEREISNLRAADINLKKENEICEIN